MTKNYVEHKNIVVTHAIINLKTNKAELGNDTQTKGEEWGLNKFDTIAKALFHLGIKSNELERIGAGMVKCEEFENPDEYITQLEYMEKEGGISRQSVNDRIRKKLITTEKKSKYLFIKIK